MTHPRVAVHRSIVVVDVERFGDHRRTNLHRVAVRAGMYAALRRAFDATGIPWAALHRDDCGDGVMILVGPEVPKARLVEVLPLLLVEALHEHNAEHVVEERIRLRLALHAGEVYHDEYGVTGASVNLTFRLLDARPVKAALAGSRGVLAVVVSSWIFDEVVRHTSGAAADYRPIRVSVKETTTRAWVCLPDHAGPLEGLSLPEPPVAPVRPPIVNVYVSGRTFTPPVPAQLPPDLSDFTDRKPLLREIHRAVVDVRDGRMVVISGAAGAGKTATAVRAAHELRGMFPGGQLYVDLEGVLARPRDPGGVLAEFLRALGADPRAIPASAPERAALYRSILADRQVLVLLDNAADERQVRQLLPPSSGSAAIITSRRPLSTLDGRHLVIDVLAARHALVLLGKLAGRARLRTDPGGAEQLVHLCGGLPLALRIIGARLRSEPTLLLDVLTARLGDEQARLAELSIGDLDVESSLALSYQGLGAEQRNLFRLLGLTSSTVFATWVAAALLGTSVAETGTLLESLVHHQLVSPAGNGRYGLHDLVRLYARKQLRAADIVVPYVALDRFFDTSSALASYAATCLRARPTAPPGTAVQDEIWRDPGGWLDMERDTMVSAVRQAFARSAWRAVSELADATETFLELRAYWDDLTEVQRMALAAARHRRDPSRQASALYWLGLVQRETGNPIRAQIRLTRSLTLYQSLGDHRGAAKVLRELGWVAWDRGRLDEAVDRCTECLALLDATEDANAYGRAGPHAGHRVLGRGAMGAGAGLDGSEPGVILPRRRRTRHGRCAAQPGRGCL